MAFQIWSAKPRRIRRGLLLLKSVTTVNGGDSGDALFENIENNSHRIERCKYRDSVLNGALSYCNAVLIMHARQNRTCIDDITYISGSD